MSRARKMPPLGVFFGAQGGAEKWTLDNRGLWMPTGTYKIVAIATENFIKCSIRAPTKNNIIKQGMKII